MSAQIFDHDYVAGDESEFLDIYDNYRLKIYRYLARLAGESEAEDLTQEVFIKVSRGLKEFRGSSSLSTWIYKIATNTAIDRLRVQSLQKDVSDCQMGGDEGDVEDAHTRIKDDKVSTEALLIKREMNDCIRGIVEGLKESYRTVLILNDFEELTNIEIAHVLGVSADTVKIRLHRARTRLRKELKAKCNFYRDERNELACERTSTSLIFLNK